MLLHTKETAGGFATEYEIDNIDQREFLIPVGYSKVEAWLNHYTRFVPFIDYEVDSVLGIFRFVPDCCSANCDSTGVPFYQSMRNGTLTIIGFMEE